MKEMVNRAFIRQKSRGQTRLNGKLEDSEIDKFCKLSIDAENILFSAIDRFGLSHRTLVSIKKVARTIADLDSADIIEKKHIFEALSYRRR
jgi:magnesium chelatase family protein